VDAETAISNAHTWFETNSGWAPPDDDTLADWLADGISRSPDDCLVTPTGWCPHGLASWSLILTAQAQEDATRLTSEGTGST
jgi:hypothetical protein